MATCDLENVLLSLQSLNSTVPPDMRRPQFFQKAVYTLGTEGTSLVEEQ